MERIEPRPIFRRRPIHKLRLPRQRRFPHEGDLRRPRPHPQHRAVIALRRHERLNKPRLLSGIREEPLCEPPKMIGYLSHAPTTTSSTFPGSCSASQAPSGAPIIPDMANR
jgi:hypothetical protein